MTLEEALELAAKELPEGAEIRICVERDAGYVESSTAEGWEGSHIDCADRTLAQQVCDHLEWLKESVL